MKTKTSPVYRGGAREPPTAPPSYAASGEEVGQNGGDRRSDQFDKNENIKLKPSEQGGTAAAYRTAKLAASGEEVGQNGGEFGRGRPKDRPYKNENIMSNDRGESV
jgi:hypothetical protein